MTTLNLHSFFFLGWEEMNMSNSDVERVNQIWQSSEENIKYFSLFVILGGPFSDYVLLK